MSHRSFADYVGADFDGRLSAQEERMLADCVQIAVRAPAMKLAPGSKKAFVGDVPYHKAFFAISLWVSIYIRIYYTAKRGRRPSTGGSGAAVARTISDDDIRRILDRASLLGVYMWWKKSVRLQTTMTQHLVCRSIYNQKMISTRRNTSGGSSLGVLLSDEESEGDDSDKYPNSTASIHGKTEAVDMLRTDAFYMANCAAFLTMSSELSFRALMAEFSLGGRNKVVPFSWKAYVRISEDEAMGEKLWCLNRAIKCGNSERESTKVSNLEIAIQNGNFLQYVSDKLSKWRTVPKSTWHMFHAMPIEFHIYMLLWMEVDDGSNPHASLTRARPLLQYLYECAERQPAGKGADSDAPPSTESSSSSDGDDGAQQQHRHPLSTNMRGLIEAIDACGHKKECSVCSTSLVEVLPYSGASTPAIDKRLSKCKIAFWAVKTKRRVQNDAKFTGKDFENGVDPQETAVSPILKQIISIVGTKSANHYKSRKRRGDRRASAKAAAGPQRSHSVTRAILDNRSLERPYNVDCLRPEDVDFPSTIFGFEHLTLYPLTLEELVSVTSVFSFCVSMYSASASILKFSVHVADAPTVHRRDCKYVVYDCVLPAGGDGREQAVYAGSAYVFNGMADFIKFWKNSAYGKRSVNLVNVQMYALSTRMAHSFERDFVRAMRNSMSNRAGPS